MSLRTLAADEFARRLKQTSNDPDKRFAFFLGAGCSISSGIPAAGSLVREHWLPRLYGLRAPQHNISDWVRDAFPAYDAANAGASYGPVMEQLFLYAEERQREIERLCDGQFPAFGYAALASLVALPGGAFNVVLTTNFDDLVADALYLFTRARPLIIHHESLAGFIRPTRTRPLIVKLHGDNRLTPRNTLAETSQLKEEVQRQVANLLHDRGLVFIGYSGSDGGIATLLQALPETALPLGIYWVNGEAPAGPMLDWLQARNAIWVDKADFDKFMLLLRDAFDLPHPERKRFDDVFAQYKSTYEKLSKRIDSLPSSAPEAKALKEAVRRTDESFPSWYAVELAAKRMAGTDPRAADEIYRQGTEAFPQSSELFGNYANFALVVLRDTDRAEAYYLRAIELDPRDALALGNYASFLAEVRENNAEAERYFKLSLELDPNEADTLGNYARFLLCTDRVEEGLGYVARAFAAINSESTPGLQLELLFYQLVHDPGAHRTEVMRGLRNAIGQGVRSRAWDFTPDLRKAAARNNPDAEWLQKLAAVIGDESAATELDGWAEWAAADGTGHPQPFG